ncbi:MAG: succinate dehydrogenase, hydrophobic membrane anchor protein [Candidatus Azosocius agrarius]|nr:MAG: succinate dehydrogenase, hydrophobic membrane anchor protein [Gammaproteobacteria bacterium]
MVAIATGLGKNGLQEWVIQRVTAVILSFYCVFIFIFFLFNKDINYENFSMFFDNIFVKIFTLISILSLSAHTWIGLWTIITDYIKNFYLRIFIQIVVNLLLMSYVFVGIEILWRT